MIRDCSRWIVRISKALGKSAAAVYGHIEKSGITIGLLGGLLTLILVGRRDAYIRRDEIFRPQRAALIDECTSMYHQIEEPLIMMTYGYVDFGVDVENPAVAYRGERSPVIPPEKIPADKEEEVKWKIAKLQAPLFLAVQANASRRSNILRLIQNYTVDPQIEIEWRLIDTSLYLLRFEDRFVSMLRDEKERIEHNASSMGQWNLHIRKPDIQKERKDFIEHSPMAFRIYFYQAFIRAHMKKIIGLILREQAGDASIAPEWLRPPKKRKIPAIGYPQIISTIYKEHELFRETYRNYPDATDAFNEW